MADLSYIFSPFYGVEPFDPKTTGAVLTGHNLVVTVWTVDDKGDEPQFVEPGFLLQPASQNDNLVASRRGAGVQAMNSRCSAQMFFRADPTDKVGEVLTDELLFVLNPPPELRQQWAQNVIFNGGDPADPANYTVLRSLMGGYTWVVDYDEVFSNQQIIQNANGSALYDFGSIMDLGEYDGTPDISIGLLKTSGADGQPPEFFDNTTSQGVAEMLAAVNAGAFFIPLIVVGNFEPAGVPARVTITYPHSVARG